MMSDALSSSPKILATAIIPSIWVLPSLATKVTRILIFGCSSEKATGESNTVTANWVWLTASNALA